MFGLSSKEDKVLMALGLKRQRMKSGSSIRDVSKRLNSKSPNAYARYERALVMPSLEKYIQLIQAANPKRRPMLMK